MANENRDQLIEDLKESFGTSEHKGFFLLTTDGSSVTANVRATFRTLTKMFAHMEEEQLKDIASAISLALKVKDVSDGPLGKMLHDLQETLGEEKFNEIAKSVLKRKDDKND